MNPFAPPGAEPPAAAGTVDPRGAVLDALVAMIRRPLPLLAACVVVAVGGVLAVCTGVGWIVLVPLGQWGIHAFALSMVDGPGHLRALWSGTRRFARVFARMWTLVFVWAVLALPILLVLVGTYLDAFYAGIHGQRPHTLVTTLLSAVTTLGWSLFLVQLVPANFLVVERGWGVRSAMVESWRRTANVRVPLALLQLLGNLFTLPGFVLTAGREIALLLGLDPGGWAAQALTSSPLLVAVLGSSQWLVVVQILVGAALYRQLFGREYEARQSPPIEGA